MMYILLNELYFQAKGLIKDFTTLYNTLNCGHCLTFDLMTYPFK